MFLSIKMRTESLTTRREQRIGLYFVLPCFLFLLIFMAYPLFRNIYLSFHNYNPLSSTEVTFAGIENYKWLINDSSFSNALYITTVYTVASVIVQGLIGIFVGVLLFNISTGTRRRRLTSRILTGIFMIPWAIPNVSAYVSWRMLYQPFFGPINAILGKEILWLSSNSLALLSIIVADVWKCAPFFIIIFLAAMTTIPREQFEAANADGATKWQEFRYIILPALVPAIIVSCIFRAIDSFTKVFDIAFLLTGGGPGRATEVLPLLIFKLGLKQFRFGPASALSVVSILISLFFGIWLLRKNR